MTMTWKSAVSALASALVAGLPALAEEPCTACPVVEEAPVVEYTDCAVCEEEAEEDVSCRFLTNKLLGECFSERTGFEIYGWLEAGMTTNDYGSGQVLVGPLGPVWQGIAGAGNPVTNGLIEDTIGAGPNTPVTFGDRETIMLNQLYLVFERAVDTDGDSFDIGGRFDFLYGNDARFTQALGLDDRIVSENESVFEDIALPQLYAEIFAPIGPGVSVKVGHFYTIIGYEVVTAPDNFFYSHAYTMQYGEPFTHTGVLTTTSLGDTVTLWNGLIYGWDSWEDANNALGYLGGASWTSCDENLSLTYTCVYSPEHTEPRFGVAGDGFESDRFMQSVVGSVALSDKLTYVFQSDQGWDTNGPNESAEWYGVNQYLFYQLFDELAVGVRGEWFCDDDGARVATTLPNNSTVEGDFYECTIGANWTPHSCVTVRPECRWDWFNGTRIADPADGLTPAGPYAGGSSDTLFTAAVDIIVEF